jgi:hypothetical protein
MGTNFKLAGVVVPLRQVSPYRLSLWVASMAVREEESRSARASGSTFELSQERSNGELSGLT